jgi:hypothetical protein
VHDVLGRRIATLADGIHRAGEHVSTWNGHGVAGHAVPTGVYLLRLSSLGQIETRRVVIMQ